MFYSLLQIIHFSCPKSNFPNFEQVLRRRTLISTTPTTTTTITTTTTKPFSPKQVGVD
jgi:hypothetical protein